MPKRTHIVYMHIAIFYLRTQIELITIKNMKTCLLFCSLLLWLTTINIPAKAQSNHQNKCSEYQEAFENWRDVQSRLVMNRTTLQDDHPLIKGLKEEEKRLLKLLQNKKCSYLFNQFMMHNSSNSESVMGLW